MKKPLKFKKILSTILSAILIMALSVPLCSPIFATGAQPNEEQRDIYYYTDSVDQTHVGSVLQSLPYNYEYRPLYLATGITIAEKVSDLLYNNSEYFTETNAYVIFEISQKFTRNNFCDDCTVTSHSNCISELLLDIFSTMKTNGCMIMFVCATDEVRFENLGRNAFLEYVDIHINTDLFFTFINSVYYRFYEDATSIFSTMSYGTFIFDSSIGDTNQFPCDYTLRGIFCEYIYPFFRTLATSSPNAPQTDVRTGLLQEDIHLLFWLGSGQYYNFTTNSYFYSSDPEFTTYITNEYVYAVGTTINGTTDTDYWLNDLAFRSTDIPVYVFGDNTSILSNLSLFNEKFTCQKSYNVSHIISDFLTCTPTDISTVLAVYDNWEGLANVTHKPIPFSENGWMFDVFGHITDDLLFPRDCWYL